MDSQNSSLANLHRLPSQDHDRATKGEISGDNIQPENDAALVTLKNVGLNRGRRWIVENVDLHVNRGQIVTLIGPNGAGKSTVAKLALGVIKPDEGQVTHARALQIGYVPQKIQLGWALPLSVNRFMQLTQKLPGKVINSALERTGAAHLGQAQMSTLSGGEIQRVLIARAMAGAANFLVLDEPTQGVDVSSEGDIYNLIFELARVDGCGVLLISHDLHLVMAETDTVICLNNRICCQGTPQKVVETAEYRKMFPFAAPDGLALYHHHMHRRPRREKTPGSL